MIRVFLFLFFVCTISLQNTLYSQTIKVATQKDYRPYSYVDTLGLVNGLLIDWWELWASKAKVDLEFIPASTPECIDLVLNGEADVISGLFFDEKGYEGLEYSESIVAMNTVLFLKKGYNPGSIEDVDQAIGIIRNELSHQNVIDSYPELTLEYCESFSDLQEKVQNKEVYGFIYDFPFPIQENQDYDVKGYREYHVIRSDKIRPAFKKGNSELLQLLLANSAKISNDELIPLFKNYSNMFKDPVPYEWIIPILVLMLVVLSTGYFIQIRKQNSLRKNLNSDKEDELYKVLTQGENDHVEFKSSLRWDYRQDQMNKSLENVIIKTISAFLNSSGGILLIGVDDSGEVLGLDPDYSTVSKKSSDGFLLTLTNLINSHLGKKVHKFCSFEIVQLNGKDLCVVRISKSNAPVFIGKNENEAFYIRASASSQMLSVSESVEYIKSHWK